MKVIGILGFLGCCVFAITKVAPFFNFIDLSSFVLVFGATVFLTLAKHSIAEIIGYNDEVVLSLINISFISGGIGFIIGIIQMLHNFSDPSQIGPGMAVSLLSICYSLIVSACLYASKKSVQTKKIGAGGIGASIAACIPLMIMYFSLSK